MAVNFTPLNFIEDGSHYVTVVRVSGSSFDSNTGKVYFDDRGVWIETETGSPTVVTRHFVPWSNVSEIYQDNV